MDIDESLGETYIGTSRDPTPEELLATFGPPSPSSTQPMGSTPPPTEPMEGPQVEGGHEQSCTKPGLG